MKKQVTVILLFFCFSLKAQFTSIPDANFDNVNNSNVNSSNINLNAEPGPESSPGSQLGSM